MALVPYDEALDRVLRRLSELPQARTIEAPPADAVGLVAASDVISTEAVPPFDNTAVDGYAVRSADLATAPTELRIAGTVAAGEAPGVSLGPGECARIMTGAVIPPGADAVVMVEDTELMADTGPLAEDTGPAGDGPAGAMVRMLQRAAAGDHVRPIGDDLPAGAVAISRGTVLRPAHVGLLATLGRTMVHVRARPRVGILSTGDELVGPDAVLRPGQIRDSNRHMLVALCRASGFEPLDLGLVGDDEGSIEEALVAGTQQCDAVITSGGVSMGDFDYVKAVLARIAEMEWMQVAIKPAKPFAFGTIGSTPVFGLPGNPVSSLVSFELFARPGLRWMSGHRQPVRTPVTAVAGEELPRRLDGKLHFVRVSLRNEDGSLVARRTGEQGSHQLASSAGADALAVVPDGDGVPRGTTLDVMLLDPAI